MLVIVCLSISLHLLGLFLAYTCPKSQDLALTAMASGSVCEVSLATLVLGEITQVTSLMRKNARWATSTTSSLASASTSSGSQRNNTGPSTSSSAASTSSGASSSTANSASTLRPSDNELAKELGLRAQKSRERIKSSSNDGSSKAGAGQARPVGNLMSGFALLRAELREIEGSFSIVLEQMQR